LDEHVGDLGYALLLKRFRPDVDLASEADIAKAAQSTIPNVPVLFWSFRLMVACGFWLVLLFGTAFYLSATRKLARYRWFLIASLLSLPLPWLAAELGWVVAEYGRQPWVIEGVLPTALGVSSTSAGNVLFSLLGFAVFYSGLAGADLYLMIKYIRLGPDQTIGHPVAAPRDMVTA
jgi:cytochrome d ubiquinol oxidase subunit I